MKRSHLILVFVLFFITNIAFPQKKLPKNVCVTTNEYRLYQLINTLRTINGLPNIELSASLTHVAHLHVTDLTKNQPDTSICNLHSWSDKGDWTPCCYQAYVHKQDCMWDKPKELTPYRFRGYELAYKDEVAINADSLMMLWMEVPKVQAMILGKGMYQGKNWQAIGIGIQENYAVVWFGQVKDRLKAPKLCEGQKIDKKKLEITTKKTLIVREKTGRYYLIFGSYKNVKEAEKHIKKYFNDGFTEAKIIVSRDKVRISLSDHPDLQNAKKAKKALAKDYKDSWIIKF